VSESPVTPPLVSAPPGRGSGSFGFRFALIYGGLAALGAVAIAVLVVFVQQGGGKARPWSTWRPAIGSESKMTQEIADYVAPRYKATAAGTQLVAVIPSSPEITSGTKATKISAMCFIPNLNAQTCERIVMTAHGNLQAQFCGIGSECSISAGTASAPRERLVRREALEMALYEFKYVPGVKAMIAYLPPPKGQSPTSMLYLERSNLKQELSHPLDDTLPLDPPPLPTQSDAKEKTTIDKLTLPALFQYQVQALRDGTDALVLTPAGS
jgi:hypothetical protein